MVAFERLGVLSEQQLIWNLEERIKAGCLEGPFLGSFNSFFPSPLTHAARFIYVIKIRLSH